ncbi:MAG: tRNA threonylcarbamoyladenosine biosynthesis protein RimN [Candidatus Competibacteraceae bacterium]|nr:tRNA threonylcarbamoyladenosine biosynthesis protein RimN [Candidatus Competibacteraceae bacterium]
MNLRPFQERRLRHVLEAGGLIAYPTEAVFGLGCDPYNETAVEQVLAVKQRPWNKGLILIAAAFDQLVPFVNPLSDPQRAQVESTWPGPVTWLLPVRPEVPFWLCGEHDTLAVRVTAHPLAAALCRAWGGALVSTSANFSGRSPARTALAVRKQLGRQVDYIIPGATGGARKPTEIRSLDGRIVRST